MICFRPYCFLVIATLAVALLMAGCAGAQRSPGPQATETPLGAARANTPDPAQALQASIEAAVRATRIAQATPVAPPTATSSALIFEEPVAFRYEAAGIAGLRPPSWTLAGDANGVILRPAFGGTGGLTATLTLTAQLPAGGATAAVGDLFAQLKRPATKLLDETHTPDGGGTLSFVVDTPTQNVTVFARATLTERGLLVVQLVVPTDQLRREWIRVGQIFDAVQLSGDHLTSEPCLGDFAAPQPYQPVSAAAPQGTLLAPALWYGSAHSLGAAGIGDFDGDGRDDLALVTGELGGEGQLYVLLQRHDQTLAAPVCFRTEGPEITLAVGDLNGDGRDDVAVGGWGEHLTLFLSAPEGIFGTRRSLSSGDTPNALAVGDLNGDGRDDVAASHWRSDFVAIFLQQEDGEIAPMISLPSAKTGFDDIAVGDVSGDGLVDVVRLRGQDFPAMDVFLQQPNHSFAPGLGYSKSVYMGGVAIGDITGDGKNDLVAVGGANRPESRIVVFEQRPNGLAAQASYPCLDAPHALSLADMDGDGRNDVVIVHWGFREVTISRQQPDGTLGEADHYGLMSDSLNPQVMDIGDLNSDGRADIVVASPGGFSLLYGRAP